MRKRMGSGLTLIKKYDIIYKVNRFAQKGLGNDFKWAKQIYSSLLLPLIKG